MSSLLHVSSSPHVKDRADTRSIMFDVAIALVPAAAFGVIQFGLHALLVILVSIVCALLTEYIWEKCMKKPLTVSDGSALVTGLLIGLNMPSNIPLWIPCFGSVFAILIVKQLYGGLGQNFMNPALAARCFLLISFARYMTDCSASLTSVGIDAATGATPLAAMRAGQSVDLLSLFLGRCGGTIGEVSALALLIGAAYLLVRKVISIRIPAAYILTFAVFELIFGVWFGSHDYYYVLCQIFAGGLILGAFFMATDYVTSPITAKGQIVYGVILGVFTGIFRLWGSSAEGVSYAIILSNILVPQIEKFTLPRTFGYKKGGKIIEKQ